MTDTRMTTETKMMWPLAAKASDADLARVAVFLMVVSIEAITERCHENEQRLERVTCPELRAEAVSMYRRGYFSHPVFSKAVLAEAGDRFAALHAYDEMTADEVIAACSTLPGIDDDDKAWFERARAWDEAHLDWL